MNAYEFTTKEYVSPIDLQTLDRTYNALEQGHLAAVQAKSQLQEAISQLDMDASEDAYKAGLVNQLQQIIADNTVYGNSYGALDKIISFGGDLVSNPGVQGRLRAQADRKAFLSNLDQMNLPSDFQEYFRAMNPYHYEDYYDDKGNVIGGSKWEPSKIPTKQFDRAKLMADAINMAAYEEGQSMNVRYLDANGNVTNDPNQAVGGQYFDITTSDWKRLTEDRIRESFMSVMNNTPGAWNAFNQEYDVALWKYNTLTDEEKSDPDNPYVKAITNEKGVTLTHDEYLDRMISGGIHAASYNRVKTTIEPNKSLTSYYQTQAAASATSSSGEGLLKGTSVPSTYLTESYDNITELGIAKEEAVAACMQIAKALYMDVSDGNVPSSDRVKTMAEEAVKAGDPNAMEYYYQYLHWMKQYLDALDSENNLTANLSGVTNGLEAYNFVQATNMGQLLDNSDNNPYAQQLVKNINDEFGSDEWLALAVSDDIYDILPDNLKEKTEFNTQRNRRYLYLKKSDTAEILQASKIFPGSTEHQYLKNKNDKISSDIRNLGFIRNAFNDNLMHKNRQLLNKAQAVVNTGLALSNDVISDQVIATSFSTLTELQNANLYNNGQINKDTFNFLQKVNYEEARNKMQMQVYAPQNVTIYGYNSDTGALELIPKDDNKSKVLQDIARFDYENNKEGMMSNAFSKIAGAGLLISIPHELKEDDKQDEEKPYKGQKNKTGKYDQYFIKGLYEPDLEKKIDAEPAIKAAMSVFRGNLHKKVFNIFTSKQLPGIGLIQITCNGNNSYTYTVGNTSKELKTAAEAEQYLTLLYYLQDLYDNNDYTLDKINNEQTVTIISNFCNILGINYDAFISALRRRKLAIPSL